MQFGNRCRAPDLTKSAANASIEVSILLEMKTRVKLCGHRPYTRCCREASAKPAETELPPITRQYGRYVAESMVSFFFCAILDGLHNFLILLNAPEPLRTSDLCAFRAQGTSLAAWDIPDGSAIVYTTPATFKGRP